ncbi:ATP-binding protein [Dongshaea marina]|uniref:ATP-binding protein n=1 Tax=Dongshaea marina TaxID=2047966 RepID=UPI000D3E9225|nr:ATP-binding protein [Dongshaea marina]
MTNFAIVVVATEAELLQRALDELKSLELCFGLHQACSINEAEELLERLAELKQEVAVMVCDHHLEDGRGVDFLIRNDATYHSSRRILLGRHPELGSIIEAVNLSRLDYYLQSPWHESALRKVVIDQATHFILKQDVDPLPYARILDQPRLLKAHVDRQIARYRQGFLDYTHYSDEELSTRLIDALYKFFDGNDDSHACRCYTSGHILTREGESNDYLWFIAKGEVLLKKRDSKGQMQEVVRYQEGALVGGMSFITGEPAFSTGVTLTRVEVIRLDKALFAKVMSVRSELLPLFTNMLLRHFDRRLQNSIRTKIKLQETLQSLDAAYTQLIDTEKMAVLGQLVAGVAHELNNPVSAIIRGAEKLHRQIPELTGIELPSEITELGDRILRQAMDSNPLSTSTIRARTRLVNESLENRAVAKKVVTMRLDEDAYWPQLCSHEPDERDQLITELERFHQVGSFLRNIDVCARRIGDLVKSLKQYARQTDGQMKWVDLHEGLEDTLLIFENRLKRLEVEKVYQPLPDVYCDPIALQQIWTNFLSNALEALLSKGELEGKIIIRTRELVDQRGSSWVEASVEDNGCGIPPELQDEIFELNFTTKREGDFGLGIGLSVCAQIVQRHQGTIRVESEPGLYTRMIVTLPVSPQRWQERRS